MTFTITNKYGHKTKNGMAARILATDLTGPRPIIAAVRRCDGTEQAFSYDLAGQHLTSEDFDLVNIEPEVVVKYCNIYQGRASKLIKSGRIEFTTIVEASQMQSPDHTEICLGTFAARYVDGELIALTKVMPEEIK